MNHSRLFWKKVKRIINTSVRSFILVRRTAIFPVIFHGDRQQLIVCDSLVLFDTERQREPSTIAGSKQEVWENNSFFKVGVDAIPIRLVSAIHTFKHGNEKVKSSRVGQHLLIWKMGKIKKKAREINGWQFLWRSFHLDGTRKKAERILNDISRVLIAFLLHRGISPDITFL